MIVEERFVTYINLLSGENTPLLEEIEKEAHESGIPIIRRETQSLLKVLLALRKPQRILEVGTAIGFSALFMAEYNPAGGHITTIENYEKRIPIARDNFERAGRADQIILLEGDAADVLKELSGPYDMIFLEDVMRLLAPEGLLVSDNVLQDGDIIESRFAVTRRNRTIHKRMREYLYCLTHHPRLTTSVLTVGDGVAVSVAGPDGADC